MHSVYVLEGQRNSAVYYQRIIAGSKEVRDVCVAKFYKMDTTVDGIDKLIQEFKEGFEKLLNDQKQQEVL